MSLAVLGMCVGCALVQGCLSVRGERVLFLDADGATDIKDLARLEKELDSITNDHVKCGTVHVA